MVALIGAMFDGAVLVLAVLLVVTVDGGSQPNVKRIIPVDKINAADFWMFIFFIENFIIFDSPMIFSSDLIQTF